MKYRKIKGLKRNMQHSALSWWPCCRAPVCRSLADQQTIVEYFTLGCCLLIPIDAPPSEPAGTRASKYYTVTVYFPHFVTACRSMRVLVLRLKL